MGDRRNKGVNIIFGGWLRGGCAGSIRDNRCRLDNLAAPPAGRSHKREICFSATLFRGNHDKGFPVATTMEPLQLVFSSILGSLLPLAVHLFLKGTDALSNLGLYQAGQL